MNEKDEKALIALLAMKLHPDAQWDLNRKEIEELLANSENITDEERDVFEFIDPLTLIRNPKPVDFPMQDKYINLPDAVGFNRSGEGKDSAEDTRESVQRKRSAIRKQLSTES